MMKCDHCGQSRDPEFSYNGHRFCCECMSELCSWFLDGGQTENPDQFAYVLDDGVDPAGDPLSVTAITNSGRAALMGGRFVTNPDPNRQASMHDTSAYALEHAQLRTTLKHRIAESITSAEGAGRTVEDPAKAAEYAVNALMEWQPGWDLLRAIVRHLDADGEWAGVEGRRIRRSFRGTPVVCGAGHLCCADPSEPPSHDHFLRQEDCPSCLHLIEAERTANE